MKSGKIIFVFLVLLFSSCQTSKYYANYRAGGKMDQEEKQGTPISINKKDSLRMISEFKSLQVTEIKTIDTLLIPPLPFNKKINVLEENKVMVSKSRQKSLPEQNNLDKEKNGKENKSINKAPEFESKINGTKLNHSTKINSSPFKSDNSGRFMKKVIFWAILAGLFTLLISGSVGLGIITVLAIILGGIIVVALAAFLIVSFICLLIGEIINSSNFHSKSKGSIKSMDHGARIATFFWILIGVATFTGLLMAFFMIPNFWVIALAVLGGIAAALLIDALLAGFLDLIMPGDSMFSKRKNILKSLFGKLFHKNKKSKSPLKYYGGMPIWLFFLICMAVGTLALILAGGWGAPFWLIDGIIYGMISIGVCCLLAGAVAGIFEGIAR